MIYPNYYYQNYPQTMPQNMPQAMPQQNTTPQIQNQQAMINTDFVKVHSENEARNYPVATGASVTFKDENAPFIYTKTMGFSQLDIPVFEKYRLVKEDSAPVNELLSNDTDKLSLDELKAEIEDIRAEIDDVRNDFEGIKRKISAPAKRRSLKEDIEDE